MVFRSVEDPFHERCVDLFERPDGTFGFEEFRRDFEDQGRWTAVSYYSGKTYPTRESAWPPRGRSYPGCRPADAR